jgi:hypothetical protein
LDIFFFSFPKGGNGLGLPGLTAILPSTRRNGTQLTQPMMSLAGSAWSAAASTAFRGTTSWNEEVASQPIGGETEPRIQVVNSDEGIVGKSGVLEEQSSGRVRARPVLAFSRPCGRNPMTNTLPCSVIVDPLIGLLPVVFVPAPRPPPDFMFLSEPPLNPVFGSVGLALLKTNNSRSHPLMSVW